MVVRRGRQWARESGWTIASIGCRIAAADREGRDASDHQHRQRADGHAEFLCAPGVYEGRRGEGGGEIGTRLSLLRMPRELIESTDVAVIGAGPIGLELAVALKRAGVDYLHFDAKQIGYTISWFAPQTRFFSSNERIAIAGVPLQTWDQGKATREEYLAYLRRIVQQFDLQIRTYEPVIHIARVGDGFVLTTKPPGGEKTIRANRVVLCTGGTDRPRRLNVPGEDLPHVSHYFQDPHTYFRKRLLIVGGKNSAVEAALRCYHAGADVSISYRRDQLPQSSIKYWLLPEI